MSKIYRTPYHKLGLSNLPDFEIRNGKIHRTVSHPSGYGATPDYEIRDNSVFRTEHHPQGYKALPEYHVREGQLFRTVYHDDGEGNLPDYAIRKEAMDLLKELHEALQPMVDRGIALHVLHTSDDHFIVYIGDRNPTEHIAEVNMLIFRAGLGGLVNVAVASGEGPPI